ncbi:PucR family transcriptional regulator [Rhodococcus sp. NPDC057014]|uniref:PucR family transcriptional regulator n=1 Tax=Rhodococcus sp. NPDC057014 TaxID=3346000 RepID=UPI003624BB6D
MNQIGRAVAVASVDDFMARTRRHLGASVVLLDGDFEMIAYSARSIEVSEDHAQSVVRQATDADTRNWIVDCGIAYATRPVRTPANRTTGSKARICLPVRHGGKTYGFLFVLPGDDTSISDRALEELMPLAAQAGALLAAGASENGHLAGAFADLLEGDPDRSSAAAEHLRVSGEMKDADFTMLATDHASIDRRSGVTAVPMGRFTAVFVAHRDSSSSTLRSAVDSCCAEGSVVGVGGTYSDLRDAGKSWRQARLCLDVIALEPSKGPVAYWDRLGVYRLAALASAELVAEAAITPAVRALFEHRNRDLLATAETFFDNGGDIAATTDALSIHRQTLYYRLRRIQELTTLDLSIGQDRLELHVGLSLGRLVGGPGTSHPS